MTKVADPIKFQQFLDEQEYRMYSRLGITREQFRDPLFWKRLREVNCRFEPESNEATE
jgi:hypothetical protein